MYRLCVNVYCTVLYCTVLYCTVLYCNVLCCTVLYCTVLLPPGVNLIAVNKYRIVSFHIIKEVSDLQDLGLGNNIIRLINENVWWFCVCGDEFLSAVKCNGISLLGELLSAVEELTVLHGVI